MASRRKNITVKFEEMELQIPRNDLSEMIETILYDYDYLPNALHDRAEKLAQEVADSITDEEIKAIMKEHMIRQICRR